MKFNSTWTLEKNRCGALTCWVYSWETHGESIISALTTTLSISIPCTDTTSHFYLPKLSQLNMEHSQEIEPRTMNIRDESEHICVLFSHRTTHPLLIQISMHVKETVDLLKLSDTSLEEVALVIRQKHYT